MTPTELLSLIGALTAAVVTIMQAYVSAVRNTQAVKAQEKTEQRLEENARVQEVIKKDVNSNMTAALNQIRALSAEIVALKARLPAVPETPPPPPFRT